MAETMAPMRRTEVVAPSLVRWGAVFSGAITGLALTLLVGTLWVALSFSSHRAAFYDHLAWWLAGTAIGATFVAGLLAGLVSGTRGPGAGFLNGLTTWGLVALGAAAGGIPGLIAAGSTRVITANGVRVTVSTVSPWTAFWALLIGLGAAILGGVMGGSVPRGFRRVYPAPATSAIATGAPAPVEEEPAVRAARGT
jgi:hypothetical protein